MIPYVNTLLVAWGRWVVRGRDGGTGWPTYSSMFRDAPAGVSPYGSKPPMGIGSGADDCEFMHRAVARLNEADQMLIREVYVLRGSTKEIAARLGWHRQRVPERLAAAGNRLMGHMNDIAAGC